MTKLPSIELTEADQFIEFACLTFHPDDSAGRRRRAERLAVAPAALANQSFLAAVVLGDVAAVRRGLAADPGLATRPGGPRGWVPLLYLGFGRVLGGGACDAVEVARLLLGEGADPNSQVLFHDLYRWTAITGAIGEGESGPIAAPPHPQARPLVELLLDAGADPNDSQALYNTHFRRDNGWLELFLSRGLAAAQPANWTADDPTRLLDYLLGQAVKQGYLDRVALLLSHGASPDGKNHYNKRTHLDNALLAGHTAIATLLARHGAAPATLSPAEELRAACLRADGAAVRARLTAELEGRDDVGTLLAAAEHGRLGAVRLLLDLGVPVDATNSDGLTALHLAAANGHRLVVDELLARGASLDLRDRIYDGTPLGRVTWFSRAWPTPERDETRRLLAKRLTASRTKKRVRPMIHVPDVRATIHWYQSVGFELVSTNQNDGDIDWALLSFGDAQVMFNAGGTVSTAARREVDLYVNTDDVEGLYQRLIGRVDVHEGLHDTFYGMREFIVRDLNGFWVTFGQTVRDREPTV